MEKTKATSPVGMEIGGERFELDAGCHFFLNQNCLYVSSQAEPGDTNPAEAGA